MATISLSGTGDIQNVGQVIYNAVVHGSITGECRLDVKSDFEDGSVRMMVFEKFYYRTSNRASLSIMISQKGNQIRVNGISTGAAQGMLVRFAWGAEDNFSGIVEKVLKNMGFR